MLTIYGVPLSVHTRKVLMMAMHKGIEHRYQVVIPVIPGNPPANWESLSPTGMIPVVDDDGYTLADSTAIALYLERKYPAASLLPSDTQEYGRALWFDAYAGGTIFRQLIHPLFHQSVVAPNIKQVAPDTTLIAQVLREVAPKIFGYLESQIAGTFLVGRSLGLADIAIASNFLVYQYCGFDIDAERYPRLARYLRNIVREDLFRRAIELEKPFVEQMGLKRSFLD